MAVGQVKTLSLEQANQKANILLESGQLAQAEEMCKRILRTQPDSHEAYQTLSLVAFRVGKQELACQLLEKAISIAPTHAIYHRNLGEMRRQMGQLPAAVAAGRKATALDAKDTVAFYNLGIALGDSEAYNDAVMAYKHATKLMPGHSQAFNNMGAALEKLGKKDAALKAYTEATKQDPLNAEAQNNRGAIHSENGNLDEARAAFAASIDANALFSEAHFNLSTLKKYTEGDPHVAALEQVAKTQPPMEQEARARFFFALGKAREDLKRYPEAFEAYRLGNQLIRATYEYSEEKTRKIIDHIIKTHDAEHMAATQSTAAANPLPIFILGMPRSGSTLTEQILASHPDVFGAGELSDFDIVLNEVAQERYQMPGLDAALKYTADDFEEIGKRYMARLKKHAPRAKRICDKMPANFMYIGLINRALPGAQILHTRRNAMDTCLSNFTRHFTSTMNFAYELSELGHYHNQYRRLMDYWDTALPEGTVLDVDYEKVVEDIEAEARRIIDHVGLDWDPACLAFHENKRTVKTASIAQVRQPIYRNSLERWRSYEQELQPLQNVLKLYAGRPYPGV
ncbi:MAG: tetratricopeptide (TPR) repeat protein [Parvibaculaceae bacterium]